MQRNLTMDFGSEIVEAAARVTADTVCQ